VIEHLDVENIKSFAGRHRAELAPITLVFGPNSAGKSTLIQSLAVLKQTLDPLRTRTVERPPLALHGDLVDLGSFSTAVYGHDRDRSLAIELQFTDRSDRPRTEVLEGRPQHAGISFRYDPDRDVAVQNRATLGDHENRVSFAPRPTPKSSQFASWGGTMFRLDRSTAQGLLNLIDERVAARSRSRLHESVEAVAVWRRLHDAITDRLGGAKPIHFYGSGVFPTWPDPDLLLSPDEGSPLNPFQVVDELWGVRDRALVEMLAGISYLGPLRAAPRRFETLSNELPANVGHAGEHTSALLSRDPEMQGRVNEWLERLGIEYALEVKQVRAEVGVELGDLLATSLIDRRTGFRVTPQDVGFGISQLLPVVVQMIVGDRRIVCVEQPEIHIHPRLQAEVGDLLVDATGPARNHQVIIETHSEHLMLRLQRRLREHEPAWLTPDHIAVLYVDRDPTGCTNVRRLHLDDDGFFIDPWPSGFFAERIHELMS
jgi:energy-coupling factor transporter ATP-binding protein EcfA2